jgi:dolichyl-phosphate-mannose-protein mannosyltransferase
LQANAPTPSFWWILYELNREMYSASARIDSPHHWESKHYQWIGNTRGVLYWAVDDTALFESRAQVYILGNPAVSWIAGAGIVVFLALNAWRFRYRVELPLAEPATRIVRFGWFCFFAYAFNLLPYLGVTRQAFIYHYMPAQFYAILLFGLLLQWRVPQWLLDRAVVPGFLVIVIVTFIRYAPWIYALPLHLDAHANRRWLKTWD